MAKLPKMNTKIKLLIPVEINGEKIKEINMRRPTLGDQLNADRACDSDSEIEIHLMASLTEIAPKDLEKLDLADYKKLQEQFQSFLS
ncbi:phage tail assembly protein [Lentisphaerota bacterium WC36G]|nr:phage tail assembly protein [Lentisphaerae bacterium WC36]